MTQPKVISEINTTSLMKGKHKKIAVLKTHIKEGTAKSIKI